MSDTPVGPVCHLNPPAINPNTQPSNIPGIPGPVPQTNNAATNDQLAALLNALRAAMLALLNQLNHGNNAAGGVLQSPKPQQSAQWTQKSIQTSKVKVFQNNDPTSSNWVEIEQINQLVMSQASTGQTWQWNR